MARKNLVIHPLLLAVFPVLFLYSHNIGQVYFDQILKPLGIAVGLALAGWGILQLILRKWANSGLIVSLFLFLFFGYGHFMSFLAGSLPAYLVSAILLGVFAAGSVLAVRTRKPLRKFTLVLNAISGIFIGLCFINIVIYQFTKAGDWKQAGALTNMQQDINRPVPAAELPDIYFIILDAYARADVLQELYSFDNSDFLRFLKNKGFYIADRSASNYCQTGLTIGACFNLSYLDEWVQQIGQHNTSHKPLEVIIEKSHVLSYLREKGYRIISYASGRAETELQSADLYLKTGTSINTFWNMLWNLTPIPDIFRSKKSGSRFEMHREHILYKLDNLGQIAGINQKPKFVFAYFELPHPPFVFGPKGKPINLEARFNDHDGNWLIRPGRLSREEYLSSYRDQIIFLNGRMKKVVDEVLGNSRQPPIIMILADHGPRSQMIWEDPEKTNAKECLSILNAYHLPHGGAKQLYPEITPVNSFRVIFNHYFGTEFSLLADKSYLSTARYLYKFYDVTEKVQRDK